jgi:hypothetical protein
MQNRGGVIENAAKITHYQASGAAAVYGQQDSCLPGCAFPGGITAKILQIENSLTF